MQKFTQQIQNQFAKMCKTGKLFRSSMGGQPVWTHYLESFKEDPIFRDPNSSEHNCNLCGNFLRRYGNILAIDENNQLMSMFDFEAEGEFKPVAASLSSLLRQSVVKDVFFETFNELNFLPYERCTKQNSSFRLGIDKNHKQYTKEEADKFGKVNTKDIYTFHHMHLDLPAAFVSMDNSSIEAIMAKHRDNKEVFKRGLDTIPLDTLELVKDLINQGSLLDGQTHLFKVEKFIEFKRDYDKVPAENQDNWCWLTSRDLSISKFRNELIGTLCTELAEGKELNDACKTWNIRVDPANYMKASAPITQKQIAEAKKFVEENGYEESFDRRHATIEDIKVSEILHINSGDGKIKAVSVFDNVKSTSTRHKRSEFDSVEEVGIEKFMKDILPGCSSIEAFLSNTHEGNLASITTANNPDSKPIFKWDNNYSWTFNGNLAGKSQIKEAVKVAGGNVTGILRASMIWNETGEDNSDLDLWCRQPNNERIGYNTGYRKDSGNRFSSCGGQLDLDNTGPGSKVGVENIYFGSLSTMKEGVYKFWVNQYSARNSKGFRFEIEFNGEIYSYTYNRPVSSQIEVAEVTLKNGQFSISHKLPATEGSGVSKEIYGLETNQFHKVNLVCLSPNHWGNNQLGNKYYFFMLNGCKVETSIRSFHNENLNSDLLQHRKVMEVLGATTTVSSVEKQLSGLGFNATVRDELIVRLQGTHKRVVKIKF